MDSRNRPDIDYSKNIPTLVSGITTILRACQSIISPAQLQNISDWINEMNLDYTTLGRAYLFTQQIFDLLYVKHTNPDMDSKATEVFNYCWVLYCFVRGTKI